MIAAIVVSILVIIAGVVGMLLVRQRAASSGIPTPPGQATPFASAMKKAGVKSPDAPANPVDLATINAVGSHQFDATFTFDELAALMNAFPHTVNAGGMEVSLTNVSLASGGGNAVDLRGKISGGGNSYSGRVTGPVAVQAGQIVTTGQLAVTAEGFSLGGSQADQATQLLLAYANGYLAAAPGLKVSTALVTTDGVVVTGTAPDSISW
jgi:hypothetical protein